MNYFDLPTDTIIWAPFPKPIYNSEMEQKNRIRITPDNRNGNYILSFLLVTWEGGTEIEQEINRIVFRDKVAVVEFKQHFSNILEGVE